MQGWIESSQDDVFTASLLSHFQFWRILKYVFFNLKDMVPGSSAIYMNLFISKAIISETHDRIFTRQLFC